MQKIYMVLKLHIQRTEERRTQNRDEGRQRGWVGASIPICPVGAACAQ